MPQIQPESRPIEHSRVQTFCTHLLAAAGLRKADADTVARSLVEANLRGIDSHGVARLPHYLNRIKHGSIKPQPKIQFKHLGPSVGLVDGDRGLGQLVMNRATAEAITLARSTGAGWVSVRDSSHCGALAFYGLQIAGAGMIGLTFTHAESVVLPYGSHQPFCGTTPICITAPGDGGHTLCLDMATSKVPWNTIVNAAMEDVPIPSGWAVDETGTETTDAKRAVSLLPFGEYKGSGLGLMIDVMCAMLSQAPYGPDLSRMYGDPAQRRCLGGLVGAIDICRFVPLESFTARVTELARRWNALEPIESGGRVLYPGEPEMIRRQERLRDGIPLSPKLLKTFDELAKEYDWDPDTVGAWDDGTLGP